MQDFILMLTEVSRHPAKLLEKARQWEQGAENQAAWLQLKPAPAQPAVVGCLNAGTLFIRGLPLLARKEVPIWHKSLCSRLLSVYLQSY